MNQHQEMMNRVLKLALRGSGKVSPNPMDSNWGGGQYTQSLVDQGYYADNEVSIMIA